MSRSRIWYPRVIGDNGGVDFGPISASDDVDRETKRRFPTDVGQGSRNVGPRYNSDLAQSRTLLSGCS